MEIEKINLDQISSEPEPQATQEKPQQFHLEQESRFKRLFRKRGNKKVLGVALALLLIILVFVFLPLFNTYRSARQTYAQVQLTVDALKKQNIDLTEQELKKTRESLEKTQGDLRFMGYMRFVPIAGWYYSDADHLVNAGFHGLDAADIFVSSVKPYADVLGLKGQGTFVGGTAEKRVETAITTMGKITPRIDDIADKLVLVRDEIDQVDPGHYPSFIAGGKVKNGITQIRQMTHDGVTFVHEARPLIKVLPSLLGDPDQKRYLILFQNDKELRPTGGFITSYSVFRLEKGIIHVDTQNDIYQLDARLTNKERAPRPILEFLPKVTQFNLRDSNLSPDYVESMKTFRQMYEDIPGHAEVEGIISVDTHALVAAMNILGDIQAAGQTFTTKNDPRCDCPQVIYELEEYADQPVGFIRTDRKQIIGDLMYAIMEKAFSSSPKLYWGPLFQTMLKEIDEKHILFYVYDEDGQKGLEALNAAGRIKPFEGDYLHINEANFGGAKSNLYVSQDVTQDYEVAKDGTITKTITINYRNPFAPSDCNLERGNLCLNAVLRNWIRFYVPKGSKLIKAQGSEVKVETYDELDKTVFEGFMTVRPKGAAKVVLSYRLPFKLASGSPLPLMVQKQPGTAEDEYKITYKGKQIEKFVLETDRTLKLDL